MIEPPQNDTYLRIMDMAEALFAAHGYTSVRLRDIAEPLGIKHAALYYYAPGGKEQLFVHVVERALARHRANLEAAIMAAPPQIAAQLQAAARWLISQPPLNLARMHAVDFPALSPASAQRLTLQIFETLRPPLLAIFAAADAQVDVADPDLAAMSFLTLIEAVHTDAPDDQPQVLETADRLIAMLLNGWLRR
jgi:AcrR family transcriptional regulator